MCNYFKFFHLLLIFKILKLPNSSTEVNRNALKKTKEHNTPTRAEARVATSVDDIYLINSFCYCYYRMTACSSRSPK